LDEYESSENTSNYGIFLDVLIAEVVFGCYVEIFLD
jgi:hypothetical protein